MPCISTATQNAEPRDVGVTSATTNTSQQIGASIGTALLNTIAATATATYLAPPGGADVVARATVHGYATASAWAAGILVLAAVLAGVLINVHPGRPSSRTSTVSRSSLWTRRPIHAHCRRILGGFSLRQERRQLPPA